jgi:hypothetical protein
MSHTQIFAEFLSGSSTPGLGPGPRNGVRSVPALLSGIDAALLKHPLDSRRAEAARALILLWHDRHEPAHAIVQDMPTPEAGYVHAILHRREPDYGNAKYWFHRVGSHSSYLPLAAKSSVLLSSAAHSALRAKILPDGRWDAFAFVEACEAALQQGAEPDEEDPLRAIQAEEFRALLDFLTRQN